MVAASRMSSQAPGGRPGASETLYSKRDLFREHERVEERIGRRQSGRVGRHREIGKVIERTADEIKPAAHAADGRRLEDELPARMPLERDILLAEQGSLRGLDDAAFALAQQRGDVR